MDKTSSRLMNFTFFFFTLISYALYFVALLVVKNIETVKMKAHTPEKDGSFFEEKKFI